jgi:hypothetical protein
MCDYSLELVTSRPAKVGDKLISAGFPHTVSRDSCLFAPGTELAFENDVRCETGFVFSRTLGHNVASFRQINTDLRKRHHDALEFPDGQIVLLTCLCRGQRATVLQVPAGAPDKFDIAERHASLVA